jgi:hypothetical protein
MTLGDMRELGLHSNTGPTNQVFAHLREQRARTLIATSISALKVMRKAEARRVTQPILSPAEAHRNREAWRKRAIDERRKELIEAGLWPAPDDWADDLNSPDWLPPPGSPNPPLNVENLAERLRAARLKLKAEKSSG